MGDSLQRGGRRERPLIAVVWSVPLLSEALADAIEFADVRTFADASGDVTGLLQWLEPDAVVVDSSVTAAAAAVFAADRPLPVVHVSLQEGHLRLFQDGTWQEDARGLDLEPESVRNVLAAALFARGART